MDTVIEKLLDEVDPDIKEAMLTKGFNGFSNWELLVDPTNTILLWQELRDRKLMNHPVIIPT